MTLGLRQSFMLRRTISCHTVVAFICSSFFRDAYPKALPIPKYARQGSKTQRPTQVVHSRITEWNATRNGLPATSLSGMPRLPRAYMPATLLNQIQPPRMSFLKKFSYHILKFFFETGIADETTVSNHNFLWSSGKQLYLWYSLLHDHCLAKV